MSERLRSVAVLAAAGVAGLLVALVKGDGDVLRAAIGNLSTPWLLIALVPAWWAGSWRRGLFLGAAATLVALLGFYVGMTVVLHGHLGVATGWRGEFTHVVRANRIWFAAGALSGPALGALGGSLGPGRRWLLGALAGGSMVAEIVVVWAAEGVRAPFLGVGWGVADWSVYLAESVLGAVVVAGSLVARQRERRG